MYYILLYAVHVDIVDLYVPISIISRGSSSSPSTISGDLKNMFVMFWPMASGGIQETRPEIPWKSMLLRRKVVNLQAFKVLYSIQDAKDSELGVSSEGQETK